MALDKWQTRFEAKLDALLKKHDLKPADFADTAAAAAAAPKLTPEEQQAIDNAPKTPTGANGPVGNRPRVNAATNAPDTSSSVPASPAKAKK